MPCLGRGQSLTESNLEEAGLLPSGQRLNPLDRITVLGVMGVPMASESFVEHVEC